MYEEGARRLIDWHADDDASVREVWRQFVKQLQSSPSPRERADGLGFEIRSHKTLDVRIHDLDRMADFLWREREVLPRAEGEVVFASVMQRFDIMGSHWKRLTSPVTKLRDLAQDLFDRSSWIPRDSVRWVGVFEGCPARQILHPEQMQSLLTSMEAYQKRTAADSRWQVRDRWMAQPMSGIVESVRESLLHVWPMKQAAPPEVAEPTLIVKRFWSPAGRAPQFNPRQHIVEGQGLAMSPGKLWVGTSSAGLMSVDVATLQTQQWEAPALPNGNKVWYRGIGTAPGWVYASNDLGIWARGGNPGKPLAAGFSAG